MLVICDLNYLIFYHDSSTLPFYDDEILLESFDQTEEIPIVILEMYSTSLINIHMYVYIIQEYRFYKVSDTVYDSSSQL